MSKIPGMVVITRDINMLETPRSFNFRGRMLGSTISIMEKQKSPHSSHPNSAISVFRV